MILGRGYAVDHGVLSKYRRLYTVQSSGYGRDEMEANSLHMYADTLWKCR